MRIAVIGDVHLAWDRRDAALIDNAAYDLALFVGDLAGYGPKGALRVARAIRKLRSPALVMPGNHDAVTVAQLAAEVFGSSETLRHVLSIGMESRVRQLERALGSVPLCGYSQHPFESLGLTILAARPHSIGGPRLAYRAYLQRRFGVGSIEESSARLCALFDSVPSSQRIVVLAHCGASGLGSARDAIFGCDFRPEQGDWGDPDLEQALAHAAASGKRVLAVVAGHMHHALRGGGQRTWYEQRAGVHHINAARVPRVRRSASGSERHHIALTIEADTVEVKPVWLPAPRRLLSLPRRRAS